MRAELIRAQLIGARLVRA
ncbi:hypothetical protein [Streptomyces sp. CBMA123]